VLHTALAAGAGLVATAFALSTFERWLAGKRSARHQLARRPSARNQLTRRPSAPNQLARRPSARHQLAWTIALACFAVAAFTLAFGATHGWSDVSFRVFYLFGAILNVPFLALGTVYLLGGERKGDIAAVAVVVVCAFATGVIAVAPLTAPIPADRLAQGSEVFGALPRVLAAVCSALPALVIFAGAVWSAVRRQRVASNVLIALGTLVLSSSGLLNSVLGEMDAFAVTLAVGVTILFAGFLVATTATVATSAAPAAAASRRARAAVPRRT